MTDTLFDPDDQPAQRRRNHAIDLGCAGTGDRDVWCAGQETADAVRLFLDSRATRSDGRWTFRSEVSEEQQDRLSNILDRFAPVLALVQLPGVSWHWCPTCGRGRASAGDLTSCPLTPGCTGRPEKVSKTAAAR